MKNLIKLITTKPLRLKIRNFQKHIVYRFRREIIRIPILFSKPIKIILGAAMTSQPGWYSTNEQWLNISDYKDWNDIFLGKCIIKNVMAEHVFEHLTEDELTKSIALIYRHLLPGGRLRIAVPDGYNPNPIYIEHVNIDGIGADAADHKQLLNYDSLKFFLESAGFVTELIEGYRSRNDFILMPIIEAYGKISRSRGNPGNMAKISGWDFLDANTSLIIDGIKPK